MNILLSSAGRRTYMVGYFKEALKALDCNGLVFASNSAWSPALSAADGSFLAPLIYSESYIPFMLKKCRELDIGLLVPLFDIDLPVLSAHRKEFEDLGTRVAVSDTSCLKVCNDKYAMALKLKEGGISCPQTYAVPGELQEYIREGGGFPLMVKPRFGMGSMGVCMVYSQEELSGALSICRRAVGSTYLKYESHAAGGSALIIQEHVSGREYGLDVITGLDGRYLCTLVRRKLAMRSGETDEAVVLGKDDGEYVLLTALGQKIAEVIKPRGLVDVDVIIDAASGTPFVIDINARFGGGYPFSHMAGADVPKAYILMAQGKYEGLSSCFFVEAGTHGYKDIVIKSYGRRG